MNIQDIPLSKLAPSPANVRKTCAKDGIEQLAASIEAHGLLQNLQVREAANGSFEVVTGSRRLAALRLMAKAKKIEADHPVPCNVLDGEDPTEISLAENEIRRAMHPADQFDAFRKLADEGQGEETIAARIRRHAPRRAAAAQAGEGQPENRRRLPQGRTQPRMRHGVRPVGRSQGAGAGVEGMEAIPRP